MPSLRAIAASPLLLAGLLTESACWPAAPIAAIRSARSGGSSNHPTPTLSLHGSIITDATVTLTSLALDQGAIGLAAPALSLSASHVDFGLTGTSLVVQALNIGTGTLAINSLTVTAIHGPDASWLTASVLTDGKTIALKADRLGITPPAGYQVQVDVDSNGGMGSFLVDVRVDSTGPTPIGPVIVDVLSSNAGIPGARVARVVTTAAEGYAWSFAQLPRGKYFLVAGVDLDSDGVIGEAGEPYGGYQGAAIPQLLEADLIDSLTIDLLVQ